MYAIIETGGKQYRVEKGARVRVEKLPHDIGKDLEISQVLLVKGDDDSAIKVGKPYVEGSKVLATVVQHFRAPKVLIFKKRSKKGYRKMQGHRQNLTEIEIKDVI